MEIVNRCRWYEISARQTVNLVLDYYEVVRTTPTFKKFKVGELLFAQHTCPLMEKSVGIWAHMDHLIYVLSGQKTWRTSSGSCTVSAGETMFFKKGAYVLHQNFQADFCVLVFFIPDTFVRQITRELTGELRPIAHETDLGEASIRLHADAGLKGFFHSMAEYFASNEQPPEALLRLKLSELITGLLLSRENQTLSAYFKAIACSGLPSLPAIMEANYFHNLSLEAFARMCHRSLSSFKRHFHELYGVPPGQWLLERRLKRASLLLTTTTMSVTEVVFECAFESPAHFSRAFKEKFGHSPSEYRDATHRELERVKDRSRRLHSGDSHFDRAKPVTDVAHNVSRQR